MENLTELEENDVKVRETAQIAPPPRRTYLKKFKNLLRKHLRKIKHFVLGYPQTKRGNRRAPDSEKPRVIVSGRNYCSNLCMARALGKAGYEVEILRIFRKRPKCLNLLATLKPDAYSNYIKAYNVCISKKHDVITKTLIHMADPHRKMLLIPVDDFVAEIIDEHYDELSQHFLLPNIDSKAGGILHMMSKVVQEEMAAAAGLPIINSCMIRTENGAFEIPESVNYPCFVKPDVSPEGLKSRMQKCENEEELREVLTRLSAKKDIEMLVQDYVEIGREYSILGVSTKAGAIGPGFFAAETGGHNERRGVAVTGRVVPAGKYQELVDKIVEFIGTLKFDGLYDVDLIETKDGKMYFVELNLRFGGSGYAITESGVNLPGMFADYMLLGKPIEKNCRVEETGKTFLSEKMMLEEYAKGFLTIPEMKKYFREADIHFIYNEEDPRAYKHFRKFYPVAAVTRAKRKLSGQI